MSAATTSSRCSWDKITYDKRFGRDRPLGDLHISSVTWRRRLPAACSCTGRGPNSSLCVLASRIGLLCSSAGSFLLERMCSSYCNAHNRPPRGLCDGFVPIAGGFAITVESVGTIEHLLHTRARTAPTLRDLEVAYPSLLVAPVYASHCTSLPVA